MYPYEEAGMKQLNRKSQGSVVTFCLLSLELGRNLEVEDEETISE